jgi:hypothetical protein
MLLTLEEIGIEAAMILATIVALACFLTLIACIVLERRELRRMAAERSGAMSAVVQRTGSHYVAQGRIRTTSRAESH